MICANCETPFLQHGRGRPRRWCYECLPAYGTIPDSDYYRTTQQLRRDRRPPIPAETATRICPVCCGLLHPLNTRRCRRCRPDGRISVRRKLADRYPNSTLKANGSTSTWRRLRILILMRDRRRCHWCDGYANTVDHVIPRIEGGTDSPANLVAACGPCNSRRSLDWIKANRGRDPRRARRRSTSSTGALAQ